MKIALRFVEGTLTGQIKEAFLYDKKHVLVGRDTTANIVLPEADRSASTTHAKIVYDKGEIYINDVGSHYGTFVNHKPATRSKIKHGDFIRFGVKGPLAEFLVVPDGQSMATPQVKPAAPVERNAQSATGAPIQKRGRPAATRLMAAPTPEMLAMLAGDVAEGVAAAAGAPAPQAAPPMPAPRGAAPGAGLGAPVVVLPGPGQGKLPPPMPIPMPVPRPQAAPQQAEPPSGRGRAQKTQVGMSAMMNPAMRRRLEQQGKLPEEGELPPEGAEAEAPAGAATEDSPAPGYEDLGPPAVVLPARAAPPPPPPPVVDETKECPFCAERIMKRAIKCRFCGEYLTTTPNKANDPDAPPALDDKLYALPRDARGPAIAPPMPVPRPVPRPQAAPPAAAPPPPSAPPPPPGAPPAGGPPPQHKHKPDMQIQRTEMFQAPTEEPEAAPAWGPPPDAPPAGGAPSGAPPAADEAPHWDLPPLDEEQGGPGKGA